MTRRYDKFILFETATEDDNGVFEPSGWLAIQESNITEIESVDPDSGYVYVTYADYTKDPTESNVVAVKSEIGYLVERLNGGDGIPVAIAAGE